MQDEAVAKRASRCARGQRPDPPHVFVIAHTLEGAAADLCWVHLSWNRRNLALVDQPNVGPSLAHVHAVDCLELDVSSAAWRLGVRLERGDRLERTDASASAARARADAQLSRRLAVTEQGEDHHRTERPKVAQGRATCPPTRKKYP